MFFRGKKTTNQITYKPDTQWNDPVMTVTSAFHEWRKTSYQLTGDCLVIFHIYLCCSTFATAKKYRILCPRPSSFPVFDAKFGFHFWRNPLMTPLSLSHFAGQQLKFFRQLQAFSDFTGVSQHPSYANGLPSKSQENTGDFPQSEDDFLGKPRAGTM